MRKYLLPVLKKVAISFLFLFFSDSLFSQSAATPFPLKKMDSLLNYLYTTERFNGTVLYAENGKTLFKKAYGVTDFRSLTPLTTHSSFNLASVTKQFICTGILILADRGLLKIDDPIIKYLPELPYKANTIRQLMTHTSGIPEYFDLFATKRSPTDTLTNERLLALYARLNPILDFTPGKKWDYSNTNYLFLAAIIERISKQPLDLFLKKEIFQPLKLSDTYLYTVTMPVIPTNHVIGFSRENDRMLLNDLNYFDGAAGDGNIYSSVEDLLTWEQQLYHSKLVKSSTLLQAFQPVQLEDGSHYPYGFGWGIDKENEIFSHTGAYGGFHNIIWRDTKSKRTLILLSSSSNATALRLVSALCKGKDFQIPATTLIRNVLLADGTGIAISPASVRIEGDKISGVGNLQPFPGENLVDGAGKILAPGFIDTHSHHRGGLKEHPDARPTLSQGITTIVVGQDGYGSQVDTIISDLTVRPVATNIATYTGHTWLREMAMGADQLSRPATQAELEKMKTLLRSEMKKGSLGLSTGLEYAGAYFSSFQELTELAKVAAANGGRYISHLRSEDIALEEALDEIIEIGRAARIPVQISHFKIALKDDWYTAPRILAKLQRARLQGINITADVYPYDFWSSTLKVLFPKTDYTNLASARFAVEHSFDPAGSILVSYAPVPEYQGKTIAEIAALRKDSAAQTLIWLIATATAFEKSHPEVEDVETIMGKSMVDEDIISILSWPHSNICSDGSAGGGHPRGYGAFTRVLGHYVREKKIMSLEEAIYKMTALAAEHCGIKNRGIVAAGYFADLVLFDKDLVADRSTVLKPHEPSAGILQVWVNGQQVYSPDTNTNTFPGQFIKK